MADSFDIYTLDNILEPYKTWEEVPVSTLWFNSNTTQICFVAVNRSEVLQRINEKSLPPNTIAYEYEENIPSKILKDKDRVILQVEIDTTNMLDTTNINEFNQYRANNQKTEAPLVRTIKPINHLGYTTYIVVYQIKDNRAVKNLQKIHE